MYAGEMFVRPKALRKLPALIHVPRTKGFFNVSGRTHFIPNTYMRMFACMSHGRLCAHSRWDPKEDRVI